ncbi:MAG: hypothetical protein JSW49_08485 [candidate division WOR-3 bacterium]|nr:MAG: hypothetical protein JSW49_08485 [candidate division WOR-3 bacterium]
MVGLPEDASDKAAQEIIKIVLRNNFGDKIRAEFPNLTKEQLDGLTVSWRRVKVLGAERSRLSIVIKIRYGGSLTTDDAREVTEYGRTIVEDAVKDYFELHGGKSLQEV